MNGLKSNFAAFIGLSAPSGTCNFTDTVRTTAIGGYPHVFFQCAEVTVASDLILNAAGYASIIAASFNATTTPLHTLLWWATPANVGSVCPQYIAAGTAFKLDPQAAAPQATACTSWPCSVAAPFGCAPRASRPQAG